jgi:hypothetical protein
MLDCGNFAVKVFSLQIKLRPPSESLDWQGVLASGRSTANLSLMTSEVMDSALPLLGYCACSNDR